MDKTLEKDRPARTAPRPPAASGHVVAGQIGSDLRASADAMRTTLDDALQRLHESEGESPVTALVERIARRFRTIHRDIGDLASSLESGPTDAEQEVDQVSR